MKGLKLPSLKLPKSPIGFAKIAVLLLVVFGVLSYLGVVALPVVVEGLQTSSKQGHRHTVNHNHNNDHAAKTHSHGPPPQHYHGPPDGLARQAKPEQWRHPDFN